MTLALVILCWPVVSKLLARMRARGDAPKGSVVRA